MKIIDNVEYYIQNDIPKYFDICLDAIRSRIRDKKLLPSIIVGRKNMYSKNDIETCLKNYPLISLWTTEKVKDIVSKKHPNIKFQENYEYTKLEDKISVTCSKHGSVLTTVYRLSTKEFGCPECGKEVGNKRMMETISILVDEFIELAREKHGDKFQYNKETYSGLSYPMEIICPIHGLLKIKPSSHLKKYGCKSCSGENNVKIMNKDKRLTQETFINRCKLAHNCFYTYEKTVFTTTINKVVITCPIHGDFIQISSHHLNGVGCPQCAYKNVSDQRRKSQEDFIKECLLTHGNKYDYSKVVYKGIDENVIIICPLHGEYQQTPYNHLKSHGCPTCGFIVAKNAQRSNVEEFIKNARLVHGKKYDYSKVVYINCDTKVEIICNKHKKSFFQSPYSHLKGNGCPRCYNRISAIEEMWLDHLQIPNDKEHRQVRIPLCTGKYIIADGYIPETNTVYQFNGDYFHGNPKYYKPERFNVVCNKTYGELYKITLEKEDIIRKSGYNLIVMWERDYRLQLKSINGNNPRIHKR